MRIYNPQEGGIVFNPEQNNIFCSHVGDAATDNRGCDPHGQSEHCTPECGGIGVNKAIHWCPPPPEDGARDCSWAPQHLHVMMELSMPPHAGPHGWGGQTSGGHYNEVVMDAYRYNSHLPWSIEAFWFDPGSSKDRGATQRTQHAAFLRAFKLTADEVPLLKLDYSADGKNMFSPS